MGHYSKDCPKSKSGVGSSKVLALNATLAQKECNRLIFLKGKISKRDILYLLDTGASHNFIARGSAERMELHLEELKAPIKVHFADGVAPLLWPSVGVKPNTWKSRELESSGTPECSELDSKAQNTSPYGVLSVIGKVSMCRCPKWPRIGHLDICSPSYGQKKGRELS